MAAHVLHVAMRKLIGFPFFLLVAGNHMRLRTTKKVTRRADPVTVDPKRWKTTMNLVTNGAACPVFLIGLHSCPDTSILMVT